METRIVQMRDRGTLTLPARLRERYALRPGDPLTVVDLDGVMVLVPAIGAVPKLAAEIERLREQEGITVEELIEAVRTERRRAARRRA